MLHVTCFTSVLHIYPRVQVSRVIGRAKQAPHWGVQSRFRVIYMFICRYVSYVKLTA